MRANIHPEYNEINVTCSCGHKFTTGSSLGKDLHIEVCNECHPFYTGKQKIVDTAGRVERFKGKFGALSLNKNATEGTAAASAEAKTEAHKTAAPQAASKEKSASAKPNAAPKAAKAKTTSASSKNAGEKKSK